MRFRCCAYQFFWIYGRKDTLFFSRCQEKLLFRAIFLETDQSTFFRKAVNFFRKTVNLFSHNLNKTHILSFGVLRSFLGSSLVFNTEHIYKVQGNDFLTKSIFGKLYKSISCICQKKIVPLHHKLITYHS